jgi:hypothetical protein
MRLGTRLINTKKSVSSDNGGGGEIVVNVDFNDILTSFYDENNKPRECPLVIVDNDGNVVARGCD